MMMMLSRNNSYQTQEKCVFYVLRFTRILETLESSPFSETSIKFYSQENERKTNLWTLAKIYVMWLKKRQVLNEIEIF